MKTLRIIMILASFLIMLSITINLFFFTGKEIPNTGIYLDIAAMGVLLIGVIISNLSKPKIK